MSQAPEGDIFLVIKDDTFICGIFTVFKNAGKLIVELTEQYPKSSFKIKPFRIHTKLIEPFVNQLLKKSLDNK